MAPTPENPPNWHNKGRGREVCSLKIEIEKNCSVWCPEMLTTMTFKNLSHLPFTTSKVPGQTALGQACHHWLYGCANLRVNLILSQCRE